MCNLDLTAFFIQLTRLKRLNISKKIILEIVDKNEEFENDSNFCKISQIR